MKKLFLIAVLFLFYPLLPQAKPNITKDFVHKSNALLVDDTKTIEGKIFVKHFVELYKNNPKNEQQHSMIITESSTTGKLNKIQVYLSEHKVYEFYVIPRDAYLYAAAQETIKRLAGQESI